MQAGQQADRLVDVILRGRMPEHSINQRVVAQLAHMSALRQAFEMGLERPLPHSARRRTRQQREESHARRLIRR